MINAEKQNDTAMSQMNNETQGGNTHSQAYLNATVKCISLYKRLIKNNTVKIAYKK